MSRLKVFIQRIYIVMRLWVSDIVTAARTNFLPAYTLKKKKSKEYDINVTLFSMTSNEKEALRAALKLQTTLGIESKLKFDSNPYIVPQFEAHIPVEEIKEKTGTRVRFINKKHPEQKGTNTNTIQAYFIRAQLVAGLAAVSCRELELIANQIQPSKEL